MQLAHLGSTDTAGRVLTTDPPPQTPKLHAGDPMDSPPIPDELLLEIFLRIPAPADIVRASVACISFRRLIADRSFLRRFRRLHVPPFLGFLDHHRLFHPVIASHPSAPAANAVARSADFSFGFLPGATSEWGVQDVRDGRVLLDRPSREKYTDAGFRVIFKEMVVCDPLHRRYLRLPPIPNDLAGLVEDLLMLSPMRWRDTFLVPPGEDDDEAAAVEGTSFRVIWMAHCELEFFAFVFSSGTGQWRDVPSQSLSDLSTGLLGPAWTRLFDWRQLAYGCFYWMMKSKEGMKMLVLDTARLEFSILEPPPEAKGTFIPNMTMVETGEGMTALFMLACGTSKLSYSIRRYNSGSSSQWQNEKTISLAPRYSLISSLGSYLFLYHHGSSTHDPGYFTLDIETFQLEKVCDVDIYEPHPYSNFPPSLSSPTI